MIWDDATALAVSPDDPTNTNDTPTTFDDVEDPGVDRDWRHGPCPLCKVIYGVQDGTGTQTSTFDYNPTTQKLETTSNNYGTIRTNRYCLINGWRYYYNPAEPTQALFAIRGDSLDLDQIEYLEITVGQNANTWMDPMIIQELYTPKRIARRVLNSNYIQTLCCWKKANRMLNSLLKKKQWSC